MTPKMENTVATTGTTNPSSPSSSSVMDRPSSPLDRIVRSRLEGKTQFQDHTDRLATLVEAVDVSVNEKARLSFENAKYGEKLSVVNKKCEELTSENAKLEVDVRRLFEENHELKKLLESKSSEARSEKERHRFYESKYNETVNRHREVFANSQKALVVATNLKIDLNKVRKLLKECRASLGKETVARVELKNKVAALNAQLKLKDEMLNNREFNETSNRLNVSGSLQESLQELRDECEDRVKLKRAETKVKYEVNSFQRENESLKIKLEVMLSRIEASNVRNDELDQINLSLNGRIRELESSLEKQVALTTENETQKRLLCEEMSLLKQQYQYLTDADITMSFESVAWDTVLRGVEQRLNVKPAAKRKRDDFEMLHDNAIASSSLGNAEIAEVDPAEPQVKKRCTGCSLM